MNCVLKVNDPTSQINRIFECTGDGWIRYFIDTKEKSPDDSIYQGTSSNGMEVHNFISLYYKGNRSAIEFHVEEQCDLIFEEGRYYVTVILIANRLIEKQEEVYPNGT